MRNILTFYLWEILLTLPPNLFGSRFLIKFTHQIKVDGTLSKCTDFGLAGSDVLKTFNKFFITVGDISLKCVSDDF